MEHKIYKLVDPITMKVRYIGFTSKSLKERLWEHIRHANQGKKDHKYNWIRSLINQHRLPIIKLVKIVTKDNWEKWEKRIIKKYRDKGCDLTNITDGGEGTIGRKWTDYQKQRMFGENHPNSKAVIATHKETGEVREFVNMNQAFKILTSERVRVSKRNISSCLKGKITHATGKAHLRKSAGGYTWEYKL